MLKLKHYLWDLFLCIFLFLCLVIIAMVYFFLGHYSSPGAPELPAFANASKTLCPTVMEICAERSGGEIYGSTAAMQTSCSQQLSDGVGDRPKLADEDKAFWSLVEHPWLLLTQFIGTALLTHLISDIVRGRRALKVGRNGGWELTKVTQEQVERRQMEVDTLVQDTKEALKELAAAVDKPHGKRGDES